MVNDATKKYREIFAYGLLGIAALYFISGLSLLFKSGDDLGGATFSDKAALFGYLFSSPLLVLSLFGAVLLVTAWGENSKNAKTVVTVALALAAISLLLGVICWFAAFGSDQSGLTYFNGVFFAGKVVGIFLGIAQLGLLGLVTFYAFTVFQTFPKRVPAQQGQWGQQQAGWGQQQGGWGQPGGYDQGQAAQPGQASQWGQPGGYDQGQAAQPGQASQWGQPGGYDQGQAGQWGQPGGYEQGSYEQGQAGQWGAASTGAAGTAWGEQSGTPAEPQGQPASSWGQPEQQSWGEQAPQQPAQPSWGTTGTDGPEQPYAAPAETAPPAADETQVWSGQPEAAAPADEPGEQTPPEDERRDDEQPPQQGWWQQPNQ